MKKVVVLQSNYIPWKGYFDLIQDADTFVFYDEVQYTKNDWRNRNRICSANGSHWLTIPISNEAVKLKISEVAIEDLYWQEKHYKSIIASYQRTPFFEQLKSLVEEIYLNQKWKNLSKFNQTTIQFLSRYLGIQTEFLNSRDYELKGDRVERLLNLLEQVKANAYITGPNAKTYLASHEKEFEDRGIQLIYKDYSGYPEYEQMAKPFEHDVSILDLIANLEQDKIADFIWGWRKSKSEQMA